MMSQFTEDIIVVDDDIKIDESQKATPHVNTSDELSSKCGEVFRDHRTGDFFFVCVLCGRAFNDLPGFGEHIRDEHPHPEISTSLSETGTPPPTLQDVNGDETDSGKDKNGIDLDVISIDDESCEEGDSGDSKQSAKCNEKFYCRSCDINFEAFESYRVHYVTYHHDISENDDSSKTSFALKLAKEFPCKYCQKTFNDSPVYENHKKAAHPSKLYTCPYCPKGFRMRLHRDRHVDMHEGKKPFKCPHCPKAFPSSHRLQDHVNIHLNLRRFACRFCGQAFVVKSNKTRHERMHSMEGPYECDECQAKFKKQAQLTIHIRKHTKNAEDFKCSLCDKTFLCSTSFEKHLLTHGSERPFSSLLKELVVANDQSSIQDEPQDDITLPECVYSDGEEADAGLNYGKREVVIAKIPNSTSANAEPRKNGNQANSRNATSQQGRETFCCYSCGSIFKAFEAYRGHYRIVHPDMIEVDSFKQISFVPKMPEEMSCQYCLRIFNVKDVYHNHMENAHLDKLYTCPLCPKTFHNKIARGQHVDAHEVAMQNGDGCSI